MKSISLSRVITAALLLQWFGGTLAAQPTKLCVADEDSIATASGLGRSEPSFE